MYGVTVLPKVMDFYLDLVPSTWTLRAVSVAFSNTHKCVSGRECRRLGRREDLSIGYNHVLRVFHPRPIGKVKERTGGETVGRTPAVEVCKGLVHAMIIVLVHAMIIVRNRRNGKSIRARLGSPSCRERSISDSVESEVRRNRIG